MFVDLPSCKGTREMFVDSFTYASFLTTAFVEHMVAMK